MKYWKIDYIVNYKHQIVKGHRSYILTGVDEFEAIKNLKETIYDTCEYIKEIKDIEESTLEKYIEQHNRINYNLKRDIQVKSWNAYLKVCG